MTTVRDRALHRLAGLRTGLPEGLNAVAVTFDDGPDPEFTPLVLECLREHQAVATFFLVGHRAEAHPALVRRIVDEGHEIGSHSYSHPEPGSEGWRILANFRAGRTAVEAAAGRSVPLFRPPNGYVQLAEAVAMRACRVVPWLWTHAAEDWEPGIRPETVVANVGAPEAGNVLLLHDASENPLGPEALDRSATVAALPTILERVRSAGLGFVPLTP